MNGRMAGVVACALVVALASPSSAQDPSGRHGDGHAEMHDIYRLWTPPLNPNTSCCDNSDCRPTRAFVDDDGHWRAWNGALWLQVHAHYSALLQGRLGVAIYSPRLDAKGNSVRGIAACQQISRDFHLHAFNQSGGTANVGVLSMGGNGGT